MANQAEMEPETAPEFDTDSVVDAGVRSEPMVRKLSIQEVLDRQAEKQAEDVDQPGSVQEMLDQQAEVGDTATRGTGSEETDRYAASVFGSERAIQEGTLDPYDYIVEEMDRLANSAQAGADIYTRTNEKASSLITSSLDAATAGSGSDEQMMAAVNQLRSYQKTVQSPWGFEVYANTVLNGLVALDGVKGQKIREEVIYQDHTSSLAANKWRDTSKGDAVWDFTKLMVLPGTTIAMADYVEQFDPGKFGTITNALGEVVGRIPNMSVTGTGFKAYQAAVKEWWTKPASERLAAFPDINEHINQIAGSNVFVYMSMIQPFIEKQSIIDLNFDYHVDTTTILAAVPGTQIAKVVKFTNQLRNYRKPISILVRTGNVDRAGALLNRVLKETTDNARRASGMTKDEAAWSAYPLDVTDRNLVPGQIQGAAADAAKQLEDEILAGQDEVNKVFRDITDPSVTPLRYYFDEAAKTAKRRQVLGDKNDYPNFARVIAEDDTGFTIEVTSGSKYAGTYDPETLRNANAILAQNAEDTKDSLEALRTTILAQERAATRALEKQAKLEGLGVARRPKGEEAAKADEAFASSSEAEKLRKQLIGYKEQIKRNERIIKDLEKPPKVTTENVKYTFKEDGTFDVETLHSLTLPQINSPSQVIDQLLKNTSNYATLAEFTEAQILSKLHTVNRSLVRGLSSSEIKDIDKLLVHGDELGRVFSVQELINGVDTRFGRVKLKSTKAISSYAGQRRVYDEIHRIKNYLHIRGLERGGYKQLAAKLTDRKGNPVKLFAKEAAERKSIPAGVKRLYDHKAGAVVDVSSIDDLGKRLDGDWSVVQFRHGHRAGDEVVNYGLVRFEKDMKPPSGQVLAYHQGYVPRTRPGVFYVVPKRVRRVIDGTEQEAYQTERFFSSKNEAYEYFAGAKDPDLMEPVVDKKYRSPTHESFDDEWDDLNFGGMYTGERSDRTILQGVAGEQANRTSSYKAMSNYMSHIANRYSTNELKANLISRFQQTYGKYLYKNGTDWEAPINTNDLKLKKAIEASRSYIRHLMRVPTKSQDWWQEKMRSIAEMMEGVPVVKGAPREWVMNFATKDPTATIRAMAFHQYLGMFNPAQWLVQGMGMSTAVAAYPAKALKLFPQNMALRAAWYGRKSPEAVRAAANAIGVNGDWLVDVITEIERTGLFDSLKTTADYNASANGISLTADAMRRMADSGLFFFREGEMLTRGYGYLLARDLFLKGKPKNYKLSPKDIDFVTADSMRFTLNLNRANAASFQKGLLSIPTQFWQITTKFYENLLGGALGYGVRKWSNAEKVKVMTGMFAMFGMAGVPLVESATNWALNAKKQATDDPTAMTNDRLNPFNGVAGMDDQDFARMMTGGLTQLIGHWVTGSDPEFTSRFSIPAGAAESWEMFAHGDSSVAKAIMGAAGPGIMRWYDAVAATGQIMGPLDWDTVGPEQFRQVTMEWAKVYSTTRNAEKADWWNTMNRITNAKGQNLMDLANMTSEEFDSIKLWQALGFGPAKVGWMYDLEADLSKKEGGSASISRNIGDLDETSGPLNKRVTNRVDAMVTIWNRFKPEEVALDTPQKRAVLNQYFGVAMEGLTEEERISFYKKFMDRILENDSSRMTKVIDKALLTIPASGNAASTTGALFNPILP